MGIEILRGDPRQNKPGRRIVIPQAPEQMRVVDVDLDHLRRSYYQNAIASLPEGVALSEIDFDFLAAETQTTVSTVKEILHGMCRTGG